MAGTFWDERYASEEYLFGTEPNAFLAREAHRLNPGSRVLAVADGEGRNGVFLAEQRLSVVSINSSAVAQDKARRLAASRGVSLDLQLVELDRYDWPPAQYDAVVGIFIQFAAPALRARLFEGMQRALKPGGWLLLEGYRPEQIDYGTGGPPHAENLYTEQMLRDAFAAMEIVSLAAYDAPVSEGSGHHGMSALIDLVAQKPGL